MSPKLRSAARGLLVMVASASIAACATKKPPPPAPPIPPGGGSSLNDGPGGPGSGRGYNNGGPITSSDRGGPAVPGSERDFVVNAGDRVYFETNAYSVSDEGRGLLDSQARWLSRYPQVAVRVEGNCDERGTREFNLALGARRAEAVKSYLASRGVSAGRITTISYGKERPLDPGTGDDAFAKNRNAHTAITGGAVGGG